MEIYKHTHTNVKKKNIIYMYTLRFYTRFLLYTHTHARARADLKPPRTVRAYCCAGHSHKAIHGSHCDSVGLLVTLIIIEKYTTVRIHGVEDDGQKCNEFHRVLREIKRETHTHTRRVMYTLYVHIGATETPR